MNSPPINKKPLTSDLPCLCAVIRKAGRVITKQYDDILKPSGLRVTQYSMLNNIRRHSDLTVSALSDLLRMDQTTVTRNLKVLERSQFITITSDPADKRIRRVSITRHGKAMIEENKAAWNAAQQAVVDKLGIARTEDLIETLQSLIQP